MNYQKIENLYTYITNDGYNKRGGDVSTEQMKTRGSKIFIYDKTYTI